MKNNLQHKHQRNKKKYFKRKHLEKQYGSPFFSFYIPILRYQFPNGMKNKICNLSMFFFINHFVNSFTNSAINGTHSERWIEISFRKKWSNGDTVKIRLASQRVVGQL